jgi:hypothetical protein
MAHLLSKDIASKNAGIDLETVAGEASICKLTLRTVYRTLYPYRGYFITEDCKLNDSKGLREY